MTDSVIKKWKEKLQHMKKEDYIVLLLIGVLLLILSLPTEKEKTSESDTDSGQKENAQEGGNIADFLNGTEESGAAERKEEAVAAGNFNSGSGYESDAYVENLEKRVEEIISGMEGAGKVKVMITLSDTGTEVLERNREITESSLEETDNAGGSRKNTENAQREEVIYEKDAEGNEVPYIVQRKLPEVSGVVVSAQGAGNASVKENIIEAVGVLFNLNEHRIKVIRMKS